MRTLIVEDSFINRRQLSKLLAPFGQADVAVNGKEALSAFRDAHAEGSPYDLIFLDISMPEMDGQEALREIRRQEEEMGIGGLDAVKVIMTTGDDSPEHILGAFRTGCEAYLIKPIQSEPLYREIFQMGVLTGEEVHTE